jgi:hypothetical protein
MGKHIYENVARTLGLPCKVENDSFCNLIDIDNELSMSIEFFNTNQRFWIWTCQSVVGDITDEGPDPIDLLEKNNKGLVWCYHALKAFEEGGIEQFSVNLKYSFATPADDIAFAERLLTLVLGNMRKCAVEVTRNL